jgi:hypothetical protein
MLLPENVSEFAVCDTYDSGTRKGAVFAWRGLIQRLRIPFMIRRPKATPEAQLAQMLMTVQADTYLP